MNNRPIGLTTIGGARGVPKDTRLRLTGQRLESTAPRSQVGPGPLHPHTIVLTKRSLEKIQAHDHTGDWLLTSSYGTIILVKAHAPPRQPAPQHTHQPRMPAPPGVATERPSWTTFVRELVIDYYDGPRALLKTDRGGQNYLVLWQDDTPTTSRWLHIPMSEDTLRQTLTGAVSLRQSIEQADFVFFQDQNNNGEPIRTVMTIPALLPDGHPVREALPDPGALMSHPLEQFEDWAAGKAE